MAERILRDENIVAWVESELQQIEDDEINTVESSQHDEMRLMRIKYHTMLEIGYAKMVRKVALAARRELQKVPINSIYTVFGNVDDANDIEQHYMQLNDAIQTAVVDTEYVINMAYLRLALLLPIGIDATPGTLEQYTNLNKEIEERVRHVDSDSLSLMLFYTPPVGVTAGQLGQLSVAFDHQDVDAAFNALAAAADVPMVSRVNLGMNLHDRIELANYDIGVGRIGIYGISYMVPHIESLVISLMGIPSGDALYQTARYTDDGVFDPEGQMEI